MIQAVGERQDYRGYKWHIGDGGGGGGGGGIKEKLEEGRGEG